MVHFLSRLSVLGRSAVEPREERSTLRFGELLAPGGGHRSGAHLSFDVASLRVDLFERGKIVIVDFLAVSRVTREAPLAQHRYDVRAIARGRRRTGHHLGAWCRSCARRSAPRG